MLKSLDAIKDRCIIDCDCWIWSGAMSRGNSKTVGVPVMHIDGEKSIKSVLRIALEIKRSRAVNARHIVWRTCGNGRCVNPAHLRSGTRVEWGQWLRKTEARKLDAAGSIRLRLQAQRDGRCVLTPELAAWIRESEQTGVEVARALAVTRQVVSKVRVGRHWAPIAGSSVFAM
jgi:hypothetical protein